MICKRADVPSMPEPFQNMRRSRAQDWSKAVPMNTLAHLIGRSIEVAAKFYLKTDEGTYARVDGSASATAAEPMPAPKTVR